MFDLSLPYHEHIVDEIKKTAPIGSEDDTQIAIRGKCAEEYII